MVGARGKWALWGALAAGVCLASASGPATARAALAAGDATTRNVRTEEAGLADVVVDSLRALENTDIALMAASSFDESAVASAQLKASDVLSALVFRNDKVAVMKLTGDQVRRALEHGLSLYPARNAAFLQVSGLTATINGSAARGARVTSVKVGKIPLDDARIYTVAMPAPLANGAVLYSKVWSRADVRETESTLEDAVNAYLAAPRTAPDKVGERLVFK